MKDREALLFDLTFALKHHVPPGVLRRIDTRRHPRHGEVEDIEARIAALAILEHLARCGWEIGKPADPAP